MKITIVGAGIAGLSAYLFLHKHLVLKNPDEYHIVIYEAHDIQNLVYDASSAQKLSNTKHDPLFTPKVIGNAIGLGKNGLAVLRRIDETGEVLRRFENMGNKVSKWKIGTARGWKIIDADVSSASKDKANASQPKIETIMIARQVAWEILRDQVLQIDPDCVIKKNIMTIDHSRDGKVSLEFVDGGKDTSDLLIGADGLRSIVRQALFQAHNDYYTRSWTDKLMLRASHKKDYITPHYEGLTGLGGFVPGSVLEGTGYNQNAMSITFGPNGFFGHGYVGSVSHLSTATNAALREDHHPLAAWWSTFSSDVPKPYEKADKSETGSLTGIDTGFDRDTALKELLARHSTWKNPTIQAMLNYIKENQAIEHIYPTYTTPELPTWKSDSGNVILIGDAAHALQPSSGQGACQALEDAEALALLLKHYLKSGEEDASTIRDDRIAVSAAMIKFVELRKPRIAKIYIQSQRMSSRKLDMNIVQEYLMYFFIWLSTKLNFLQKYNDELFEYDLPKEVKSILEHRRRACNSV